MTRFLRPVVAVLVLGLGMTGAAPGHAADHGATLWYDLVTEDAEAAASFYEDLFGWEIGTGRDGSFLVSHRGRDIASIFQISNNLPAASESQWLVGVVVNDLGAAVEAARNGGGKVLRDVTEVSGSGTYAVIRDPQGAPLILGTPTRDIGGPREHGFFAWVELWTDDLDGAAAFYEKVIGYDRKELDREGGAYTVFESGGKPRAGLVPTPNGEVNPVWAPYVGVDDLAAILKKTTALGGRVVLAPREDFGGGRLALIEDPADAMIFVAQLPEGGE